MGWLLFEGVEITNWGARLPQNRFGWRWLLFEELWTPSLVGHPCILYPYLNSLFIFLDNFDVGVFISSTFNVFFSISRFEGFPEIKCYFWGVSVVYRGATVGGTLIFRKSSTTNLFWLRQKITILIPVQMFS